VAAALGRKGWGVGAPKGRGRRPAKRKRVEASWVGSFFTLFLLMGCLVGLALFHVWLRLQVVRLGYVLSTTSKLQAQLEQENRELQLEFATLTSPDRLGESARVRLGLRDPEKGQLVVLP
jgi:cell division protein FtsL